MLFSQGEIAVVVESDLLLPTNKKHSTRNCNLYHAVHVSTDSDITVYWHSLHSFCLTLVIVIIIIIIIIIMIGNLTFFLTHHKYQ